MTGADPRERADLIRLLGDGHEPDDNGGDGHPVIVYGCPWCIAFRAAEQTQALIRHLNPHTMLHPDTARYLLASQMLDITQHVSGRAP